MKPLNKFTTAFQTYASHMGSTQADVCILFKEYMRNFIKPEILSKADDITVLHYFNQDNQGANKELEIEPQ